MTIAEIRALYDREQRREVTHPGMRREVVPQVIRHVDLLGHSSIVLHSQLDPATADAVIEEQIAYFDGMGHDFEWKVYDYDPPPDLRERLAAHGFAIEDPEAIMVLDLADLPTVLAAPVTADIRPVTTPAGLREVIAVEEAVWEDSRDWLEQSLRDEMALTPDDLRIYVAYVDGVPAGTAWIRFHPGSQFAGLWGGSTLAAYRGRGLYTALLAVRTQDALGRGVRFLTVDASPMSRPILEKLGFRRIATATACNWSVKRET